MYKVVHTVSTYVCKLGGLCFHDEVLYFITEFPDGFLTEDCSFRCSCSPFRFSNILFEIFKLGYHVQNVNIDLHLCVS